MRDSGARQGRPVPGAEEAPGLDELKKPDQRKKSGLDRGELKKPDQLKNGRAEEKKQALRGQKRGKHGKQ